MGANMISTKEENIKVLFRTNERLETLDFPQFNITNDGDGSFVVGEIYNESQLLDTIHNIINRINEEKIAILLHKKYQIIVGDDEQIHFAIQNLLAPNFNAEEFCLSKCTFFVNKVGTYSVSLDYDFENILDVEVTKFVEKEEDALKFTEYSKSILQDIIVGIEESL